MNNEVDHKIQNIEDGYGPVYHRVYRVSFPGTLASATKALKNLQKDPDQFSPHILARFERVSPDEFLIHITGPWNGPVKMENNPDHSFTLKTLEGHLEAGEIRFRILPIGNSQVYFEIESMARSKDKLVDFVYDKVPIARFAQTEMWCAFCKSFAEYATATIGEDKEKISEVSILTERKNEETGQWERI